MTEETTDSLVIIPTYNERENIARMIHTVFKLPTTFHLLIVDDNSPDGTAELVESLQIQYPDRLFILKRAGKMGLGTAYIAGFRWGLQRHYTYFLEMD
ncbi:MAG: glycosyltransferase, partial [Phaeodactylibacter sp.]|nr:glycosyltransferase [Phaeodactylibacter sp.]